MLPNEPVVESINPLWPQWIDEQRNARIVGEVYGNIHMSYPEITREQVAEQLALQQKSKSSIATNE